MIMRIFRYIFIILCLMWGGEIYAQSQIVSGKVLEVSGGKKQAAIGVNVVVVNTQNRFLTGVITDVEGNYHIRIPEGEKGLSLNFSFIGLKSKTVAFTGQKVINVELEEDVKQLDEVVVTGERIHTNSMGLTDKQVITANQRVNIEEMVETLPITSVEDALQGQLGGVDIITGGDPGSRSSIRVRGTSSLTGSNEPLIVIDGVPYDANIDDDFDFATANDEDFGALLNIAPTDIESIEVLKDAAATAIWGTKGGNGVLLITTKRGRTGKTNFSFSTKFSVKEEPNSIPMLSGNQYTAMIQDAVWNTANAMGLSNATSTKIWDILYGQYSDEIGYNPSYKYFDEYNQNVKWLDEVRQTALTTDNAFSMSGGGEKATYRFSLNYLNEQGTTIGTGVERFTSGLNIQYRFSNRLRVDANFSYAQTEKEEPYTNVRSEAFRKMPNQSPYYIDDATGERTSVYFTPQENFQGKFSGSSNFNAVAMAHDSYNNTTSREGKILFRLNYEILPSMLTYEGYVSLNMNSTKNKKFLPFSATGVVWTNDKFNLSSDALSDKQGIKTENKLIFKKNWNNLHNIVATALVRTSESNNSSYSSSTSGNASSNLADPTASGSVVSAGSGESKSRSVSFIGSVHYTLLNRYMVSGTINSEGNSSMGGNNRFGYFPAVAVGWIVNEESFLRDKEWLEMAKLRFSFGQSGKSASGAAPYVGTFAALDENYLGMTAIGPKQIQLDKLKWQTSTEYNIGVDLGFLQNHLTATFEWYTKETKDLLQKGYRVPVSTGYETIAYYNSGRISNKGWEFRLSYEVFRNKDWRVAVDFNASRNVNKVLELPANMVQDSYSLGNGKYATRVVAGDPVGSFYGYRSQGVYSTKEDVYARDAQGNVMTDIDGNRIVMKNGTYTCYPGDARYEDINHDGIINAYDIVYLGNANPFLIGGAGVKVKYKNWSLGTSFYGRFGQKVINEARMNNEAMFNKSNQSTAVLRRWRREGDVTDIPRALYDYGYNYLGSDRFVEKCSYVRMKSLTLTYDLPKQVLKRIGFNKMSIFVTGYDLLTWTNYTGQDPEVSLPSSAKALCKDSANTPRPRRFTCGLNINF